MELITAYAIYMTGAILLVGLFAIRCPHEDIRTVFALGLAWPVSILGIVAMIIVYSVGWDFDVVKGTQTFGFRRPTNPQARGFAVTVFSIEFQLYSVRKSA